MLCKWPLSPSESFWAVMEICRRALHLMASPVHCQPWFQWLTGGAIYMARCSIIICTILPPLQLLYCLGQECGSWQVLLPLWSSPSHPRLSPFFALNFLQSSPFSFPINYNGMEEAWWASVACAWPLLFALTATACRITAQLLHHHSRT